MADDKKKTNTGAPTSLSGPVYVPAKDKDEPMIAVEVWHKFGVGRTSTIRSQVLQMKKSVAQVYKSKMERGHKLIKSVDL